MSVGQHKDGTRTDAYRTFAWQVGDEVANLICSWCDAQEDPEKNCRALHAAALLGRRALLNLFEVEMNRSPLFPSPG